MAASERIDDLRRRVDTDPASIAFAQLAEEYRRAGQLAEAVDTCRAGLARHPEYISARVTLGRALLALGWLDEAHKELGAVQAVAPDNLAAIRALAETCRRQGLLDEARSCYASALRLAPNDPDLERIVADLADAPAPAAASPNPAALPDADAPITTAASPTREVAATQPAADDPQRRARATIAALERWLEAIHAARPDQHP